MSRFAGRSAIRALLITVAIGGCSGGAVPTPQIIYVTAAPTKTDRAVTTAAPEATPKPVAIADVTPEPTPRPKPAPTPKPTPEPTPPPISYAKLTSRTWAQIVKDPDAHFGETYAVWACIYQFDSATGPDAFLAYSSYANRSYWFLDGENSAFTGDAAKLAPFVENDVVLLGVTVLGSYSYDTQAGGNTTVPSFEIGRISRKGSCD